MEPGSVRCCSVCFNVFRFPSGVSGQVTRLLPSFAFGFITGLSCYCDRFLFTSSFLDPFSCLVSGSTPSSPATSNCPVPCGVPRKLSTAADTELLPAAAAAAGHKPASATAADSAGCCAAEACCSSRTAAPGSASCSSAAVPCPGASGKKQPGLGEQKKRRMQ